MNEQPVSRTGYDLINAPRWNKGTAFSDEERDVFSLHGLLPSHVGTLEEQIERRMRALRELPTAFENYAFLRDLQDTNERSRRTSGNRRTSRMREAPPARAATEGERVPAGNRSRPARERASGARAWCRLWCRLEAGKVRPSYRESREIARSVNSLTEWRRTSALPAGA